MTAPAIVHVQSAALEQLDPASREAAVTAYLSQARDQLALAVQATGPEAVAAIKAEIATAAEATKQLGLSKEIQADAQEMVRRANYAVARAVRRGQAEGTVRREHETAYRPIRESDDPPDQGMVDKASPMDYFASKNEATESYALADDVTEAEFEAALSDARAEGNLSRANVVRKIKGVKSEGLSPVEKLVKIRELAPSGMTSGQIGKEIGVGEEYVRRVARDNQIDIPADRIMSGSRRGIDHTRIVRETVAALEGLVTGLQLLDPSEVDQADATYWATSLSDSLRALNRLNRQIKEMTQ